MAVPDSGLLADLSLKVNSDRPLYAQLVDELRVLVESHFQDGDLFYSEKTLAERLPVSKITIRRALRELTTEGLLLPWRGRGTTIRKIARYAKPAPAPSQPLPKPAHRQERAANRILGIFLPGTLFDQSEHAMALMREFQLRADARGIDVRFHDCSDMMQLSKIFRSVSGHRDEHGFILHTPTDAAHLLYHALDNRGYRSVAMEGIAPDHPGHVVSTDAAAAVRIGMNHLTGLGHRRIVLLVNEPESEYNVLEKIQTFQDYAGEQGLDLDCRIVSCENALGGGSYEAAYTHMEDAFASRPTAIFTVSDPGAWAALKWCSQNGIRVPQDASILGFENARSSQYMNPAVSSVAHPNAALAEAALNVLWGNDNDTPQHILIPPVLVVRESTGNAPRRAANAGASPAGSPAEPATENDDHPLEDA